MKSFSEFNNINENALDFNFGEFMKPQHTNQIKKDDCVFCDKTKIEATDIKEITYKGVEFLIFTPLSPCTAGHLLVIPKSHYENAKSNPTITGLTFELATKYAQEVGYEQFNLITNCGKNADQIVFHLHIHIIPRHENDEVVTIWDRFNIKQMKGDTYEFV